jgi:hypothetical protein
MERTVCPCNGKLYTQSHYSLHKKGRCHQDWEQSIAEEIKREQEQEQEETERKRQEEELNYFNDSDGEEYTLIKRFFN